MPPRARCCSPGPWAAGLWALRVRNVMAQKTAWILVLVASLTMPVGGALGCANPMAA